MSAIDFFVFKNLRYGAIIGVFLDLESANITKLQYLKPGFMGTLIEGLSRICVLLKWVTVFEM